MSEINFPFPFTDFEAYDEQAETALTLVDLRMIELSYALRSKPLWWINIKDPAIRLKWKAEALEYESRGDKLKETEIEWVFDELDDYGKMRNENTGIQASCHVRIWESDELISQELNSKLKLAVADLEKVPKEEKDWRAGCESQVLDLVDPSLFCTVYGRTQYWNTLNGDGRLEPLDIPDSDEDFDNWAYSDRFSLIPTDFQIEDSGAPATALGYINNVHPKKQKDLTAVIECLVGRFSLLWDKVLTTIDPHGWWLLGRNKVTGSYTWTAHPDYPRPLWEDFTRGSDEAQRKDNLWNEHKIIKLPTVDEHGYHDSGQDITFPDTYSIQGNKVQIIVKLESIHLTPEKPEYPGGSWHIEGMANERIVASGIYYYDCENTTESQLAFRVAVNLEGALYEEGDSKGIKLTWGLESDEPSNQVVGAVKTSANRCIAWPNIYQHQVSSFKLVDPTKQGHRKIVALFLVDPEKRIPSTSDIPPQQSHWTREAIMEALVQDNRTLPVELVDMVVDGVDNMMNLEEAKAYREELMEERLAFADTVDKQHFCTGFDFRKH
ncbi:hypothetical protein M407DRAFT_26298 [Tulasnella calospora MUT 4182]|uniref:Uncharacterized protein n=1 Tax=Tulasnella calospora MUT 4182 TaxID=1051891 RepID=A0A0C3KS49_9AGAM|nr:hypothetical protein M407DRAFT_26298 [Tulasnella calospora MUT 4182]